jgi:acetylornithine/N-succinyldiaminopimelate aminotransferase
MDESDAEGFLEDVNRKAGFLRQRLEGLVGRPSGHLRQRARRGPHARPRLQGHQHRCGRRRLRRGRAHRARGDNVVRILPALTITEDEIAEGISRLDAAATALERRTAAE